MKKPKAVLFDLDGTLRDTRESIYQAYEETLEVHTGRRPTREELKPHIHHHSAVHHALTPHIDYEYWLTTYREKLGDGFTDAPFYSGTEELLEKLRREGYALAVVTSADFDRTKDYLRYRGLDGYFAVVAAVRDGIRPKPEPDLIYDALTQLGLKPTEAVMIGDMVTDVQAAHTAGVPCIAVTHGFSSQSELEAAGADAVVSMLSEIPSLLSA